MILNNYAWKKALRQKPTHERFLLMGCVDGKLEGVHPAKDLYRSGLWTMRREYAEASGLRWAILSAKYGIILPDDLTGDYQQTIAQTCAQVDLWADWASGVFNGLKRLREPGSRPCTLEVHAGMRYVHALRHLIQLKCAVVEAPLKGLGIGQQRGWYADQRGAGQ